MDKIIVMGYALVDEKAEFFVAFSAQEGSRFPSAGQSFAQFLDRGF